MPKTPRGKRVVDDSTGRFTVAARPPNGQAQPYFDRTRGVWVAPWRRPDGKVGKPTGRTRALAEASRDRHIDAAKDDARLSRLTEGFHAQSTLAELIRRAGVTTLPMPFDSSRAREHDDAPSRRHMSVGS